MFMVIYLDYTKSTELISTKLGGVTGFGKNLINLGVNVDKQMDPDTFFGPWAEVCAILSGILNNWG